MRVIYGINPVEEAIRAGESVEEVLITGERGRAPLAPIIKAAASAGLRVKRVTPEELYRVTGTKKAQGVAALIRGGFKYRGLDEILKVWRGSGEKAFFLVLDSIQDPRNLGAIIRSASGAGVHGIIIPRDRASSVTPATVKASAGATEHIYVARETNLVRAIERLQAEGVWVAALEAHCPEPIYSADLKGDVAIVIGGEGKGIRRLVRKSCDLSISIPMTGKLNSLNAAQAGTVVMFEVRRQRL
ncbi:MAG: 23S rRNA (guanosine(2251)-2'-O)-methyltransferase RlmB, partial [Thermodesulfobacteriota bacterium]